MFLMSMSLIIMMNIIFTVMTHPWSITVLIILQTLSIFLLTGLVSYSFWFSYIVFLIFLGGMLALFI